MVAWYWLIVAFFGGAVAMLFLLYQAVDQFAGWFLRLDNLLIKKRVTSQYDSTED